MSETIPALVSADWLKEQLDKGRQDIVVVDASYDVIRNVEESYSTLHIPGAIFFDLRECRDKSSPYRNTLLSPQDFARYVGNLGIDNKAHLVIYDNNQRGLFSATRVWWMFRAFGHDKVSILNGGLMAWTAGGHSVTDNHPNKPPKTFHAVPRKEYVKTFDEMAAIVKGTDPHHAIIVDLRPATLFAAGHMPKAKNILHTSILNDPPLTTMKDEEGLLKVFNSAGIDFSQPVIFQCTSGIASCTLFFAACLLGKKPPEIAVYDGSWSEWEIRSKGHHGLIEYPLPILIYLELSKKSRPPEHPDPINIFGSEIRSDFFRIRTASTTIHNFGKFTVVKDVSKHTFYRITDHRECLLGCPWLKREKIPDQAVEHYKDSISFFFNARAYHLSQEQLP